MENFDLKKAKEILLKEETSEKPKMYNIYFIYGFDKKGDIEIEASSSEEAVTLAKQNLLKTHKNPRYFTASLKHNLKHNL